MANTVIVDGARSPIGRGHPEKGIFKDVRADDLLAHVVKELVERNQIDAAHINDIIVGVVGQYNEHGKNLGRLVALLAGFPPTVPGCTVNRLCASSMQAVVYGALSIDAGLMDLVVAGGVEHLGHHPMTAHTNYNPRLFENYPKNFPNMGWTAELLAEKYQINRTQQDAFAVTSNQRAVQAFENGRITNEIIPIPSPNGLIEKDQEPRADTSLESLGRLKTPFIPEGGTVTAGNASGISDGAGAVVLASPTYCKTHNLNQLGVIKHWTNVALKPQLMGWGPVPAVQKLLADTGLRKEDIDLWEINEAFSVQILAVMKDLELEMENVNVNGGAVALGHPLGCTGVRLVASLAQELKRRNAKRGIATLCVGHGQGMALLIESE